MSKLKPAILAAALALGTNGGSGAAQAEPIFAGQKVGMYPGYVTENLAETRAFFVDKLGLRADLRKRVVRAAEAGGQPDRPDETGTGPAKRRSSARAYRGTAPGSPSTCRTSTRCYRRADAAGIAIR